MIVLVLSACPVGLRGHLTRWLLEIAPGVFVGHLPARVRDLLWETTVELVGTGRAILVHSTTGEQRLAFRVHNHAWQPVSYDGVQLMQRPKDDSGDEQAGAVRPRAGWSAASRRRRRR